MSALTLPTRLRMVGNVSSTQMVRDSLEAADAIESLERQVAELRELVLESYTALAPIHSQWHTRHTLHGQRLLSSLLETIANFTGHDAQSIQDDVQSIGIAAALSEQTGKGELT